MNRFLKGLMATIVGVGLLAGIAEGVERNAKQRFSMAISGGASKGAYEAGLNWAALKLVRETEGRIDAQRRADSDPSTSSAWPERPRAASTPY